MIDRMIWREVPLETDIGMRYSWTCVPSSDLRYIINDQTEAHHVHNKYVARVGILVCDENNHPVSDRRIWADMDFIIDPSMPPSKVTTTLDSAFRTCAVDFASRKMQHKIA